MKIIELSIENIKPYPKNAKQHKDSQIKKIANSIKEFGFNQPIVIDKEKIIVVGHGRYFAAQSLSMETVPTITVDLDEERAKSYRLADNKLNESEWEMDIVIEELKGLSLEMIDLTGFNSNLILETKEDKPDLSAVGKPRSKLGDLYELGPHKLICGDSTDVKTYEKLLGDERARLIFTDPLDVWYQKRDNTIQYIHPTQKPVQLAERALKRSSEKNDIVLDAFGGSGSTLIACDQLERKCRMIELDPKYVDCIVSRYCKYKEDMTIVKNGKQIQWLA